MEEAQKIEKQLKMKLKKNHFVYENLEEAAEERAWALAA